VAVLERRWASATAAVRIPMAKVTEVGIDVRLDLAASETGALAWEEWVGKRLIRRIPGSGA
jgi:hypothetical protein